MLGWLVLVLVAVPLVELVVLLRLAGAIGFPATVAVVIATGGLGAMLARSQGVQTIRRLQHRLRDGGSPSAELLDGGLILLGGGLLLTPGLLTDGVGFLLLFPVTRPPIREALRRRLGAAGDGPWVNVEVVDGDSEGKR